MNNEESYLGFEQGPIRPPSEANSLLIRVTRNCPWNRCTFCPVYKETNFSIRPIDHVKKDIDFASSHYSNKAGIKSVFIQDANSLIIKPRDLIEILIYIRKCFPFIERITSYARAHTISRIKDEDLKAIKDAGLNRIHIGMESASDMVLEMVRKGVNKETQIKAGIKVKNAQIELSEYVMPGLGGQELSKIHAIETADALNQINPDFIRLRTLAIPNNTPLYEDYSEGRFKKCTDVMVVEEILMFIENLNGITSLIKSDHILNLLEEVEGKLPEDKERIISVLKKFLSLDKKYQSLYQIGRRIGLFSKLSDLYDPYRLKKAEEACQNFEITPNNVDSVIDELMKRFI
ncbi:MAG: radical SAM protein [Desulfobacterales bacterium]|nr:radical SAM protein [Desulfobacterales bacterium]MBF0396070.1 radical SAM protein [Desulfobacterales bacterium]